MNENEYRNMYEHELNHWWYQGLRQLLAKFMQKAPIKTRDKPLLILDAGCGTGGNTWVLRKHYKIVSLDVDYTALRFCQSRHLKNLIQGSVDVLPFPDHTFDGIFTMDVLYHLNVKNTVSALREMHRVLKPNGFLILQLPAFECLRSSHDTAIHTRQRFHLKEVARLLDEANLAVEFLSYRNFFLFPLIALVRLFNRRKTISKTSDITQTPSLINFILRSILSLENFWLARLYSFPIGLSIWGVVRK